MTKRSNEAVTDTTGAGREHDECSIGVPVYLLESVSKEAVAAIRESGRKIVAQALLNGDEEGPAAIHPEEILDADTAYERAAQFVTKAVDNNPQP